jgi:hypothetical protein
VQTDRYLVAAAGTAWQARLDLQTLLAGANRNRKGLLGFPFRKLLKNIGQCVFARAAGKVPEFLAWPRLVKDGLKKSFTKPHLTG